MSEDSTIDSEPATASTGRSRHPLAYYAVGAILLLVIAWFCWPYSTAKNDSDARLVAPETASGALHKTPGDDGNIEIREEGFSPVANTGEKDAISWGVTLANSSELSVAVVSVTVDLLDEDGESLIDSPKATRVPQLLPNEKTGFGEVLFPDSGKVEDFDLNVTSVEWKRMDELNPQLGEVTVSEVSTEPVSSSDSDDVPRQLRIDFRVDSQYDRSIEPGAAAVYRDADGEIIGGFPPQTMDSQTVVPPGWSQQHIEVEYWPPEDIDEDATEVFVHGDGH